MRIKTVTIVFLLLASMWLTAASVKLETEVNKLHQEITRLSEQVQQTQAEIADLKNQQQTINSVSEDLSARLAAVQ